MTHHIGNATDPVDMYNELGFAVLNLYGQADVAAYSNFAIDWLYDLLTPWIGDKDARPEIASYHLWCDQLPAAHRTICDAERRHTCPAQAIEKHMVNDRLTTFLKGIGVETFDLWDEGLGWLSFRLIRPGLGDGYPFSRKAWGPAKNVISAWIPVIGHSYRETLTVVPGSHLQEYERFLPNETKFRKDEYRLVTPPPPDQCYSPDLKQGEIIVYHPKILHTEDVTEGNQTRLNLEFRIHPGS